MNAASTVKSSDEIRCELFGILTDKPKYDKYLTLNSRVSSFKNWPKTKSQNITELAKAGFGYTGIEDAVRCYFCGIGLKDWPVGACPWEQHILASPKCGHVKRCRGIGYINKLTRALSEEESTFNEIDDSDEVIDTAKLAIARNKESVEVVRQYCSDENIIRKAVKSVIKADFQRKFSAVELMQAVQSMEDQLEAISKDKTDLGSSLDEADIEDNRNLKDVVTCKICFDAVPCIITLPCGHMVTCAQCISALKACAVCRAEIKGTVRALMVI